MRLFTSTGRVLGRWWIAARVRGLFGHIKRRQHAVLWDLKKAASYTIASCLGRSHLCRLPLGAEQPNWSGVIHSSAWPHWNCRPRPATRCGGRRAKLVESVPEPPPSGQANDRRSPRSHPPTRGSVPRTSSSCHPNPPIDLNHPRRRPTRWDTRFHSAKIPSEQMCPSFNAWSTSREKNLEA